MTEIHTYRCDVCGKDFNNKDDCRKHEMEHITAKLKSAVVMMDSCGEILSLDDMSTAIERSYAIYVGCKEAADIGFILIIIGIVTVCAFILPPKAWIMLLGVVLVTFGIFLLRC